MTLKWPAAFACLACAFSQPSAAADLGGAPPPPKYNSEAYSSGPALQWYGAYVGLNAGYNFNHDFLRETSIVPYNGVDFERFRSRNGGFTGGGQVGYNYQTGNIVLGIEADFNYANLNRSVTSASGDVTATGTGGYVGTVRPRLGLAFGPWLLYGTGGLAYGSLDTTVNGNTANAVSATNSDWRAGWVAGAGVEFALDRNWSIRAEYLHYDLGHATLSGVGLDGATYSWRDHVTDNAVRLGVNFRF